jgi:hypothetical protein
MKTSIEIADALVSELNGHAFAQPFTAVRKVRPATALVDLANIQVSVVPRTLEAASYTREASQMDHGVNILVQKKLSGDIDEAIESVIALVMEIAAFIRNRNLASVNAKWVKAAIDPLIYDEHLLQDSVSTTVISATYKIIE